MILGSVCKGVYSIITIRIDPLGVWTAELDIWETTLFQDYQALFRRTDIFALSSAAPWHSVVLPRSY
jgi:hypothetical protein